MSHPPISYHTVTDNKNLRQGVNNYSAVNIGVAQPLHFKIINKVTDFNRQH